MMPNIHPKINVLIVDDEALIREGLRSMLEKETFIGEVIEAFDADGFNQKMANHTVHIVLMDIRLRKSTGLELIKNLKTTEHHAKIIAVTGMDGIELILNLLKLGVHGIVYKLDGYEEIIKSIRSVNQAGNYFPENILKIIQSNAYRWEELPPVMLSFAEKELLRAIAEGDTTKKIALKLKMSPATVETYRIRLM